MKLNNQSKQLLQSIFEGCADQAHVEWWKFGPDGKPVPSTHGWGRGLDVEIPGPDYAVYYSCGLLKPGTMRANENVTRVMVLVFDDVGTKLDKDAINGLIEVGMLPKPDYVVESSEGNYQYGWYISDGTPDKFRLHRRKMAEHFGVMDGTAPSHLFRLPDGVNGKPGKSFAPHMVEWPI